MINPALVLSGPAAGSYCFFLGDGGQRAPPPLVSFHLSETATVIPPWPIFVVQTVSSVFLKRTWVSWLVVPASPGTQRGTCSAVVINCISSMDYWAIGRASPSSVRAGGPGRPGLSPYAGLNDTDAY